MKIEILTRNTAKKADLLTYLKRLAGFVAEGDKVYARDVEAEMGEDYLLLAVQKPWLADDLIRLLFDVRPVPFASAFYEIIADHRIIVTCRGLPPEKVLSSVEVLEHLDLEAGELAGRLETRWNSRDVGIYAQYEVVLQGGVAVSRIKMGTHFRESQHHCREVISMVSLGPGLSAFCAEKDGLQRPPRASAARASAVATVGWDQWAVFMNGCPGRLTFNSVPRGYRVDLSGRGNVLWAGQAKGGGAELQLSLEEPWSLDAGLVRALGSLMGTAEVEVLVEIEDLAVSPDHLIKRLGFVKERNFTVFSAKEGDILAEYDIGSQKMSLKALLPWNKMEGSRALFSRLEAFTGGVMSFAV
jgi:hypothetical protein